MENSLIVTFSLHLSIIIGEGMGVGGGPSPSYGSEGLPYCWKLKKDHNKVAKI